MIYVITRSLAQGRFAGVCSAVGVIIGILVHTALAVGAGATGRALERDQPEDRALLLRLPAAVRRPGERAPDARPRLPRRPLRGPGASREGRRRARRGQPLRARAAPPGRHRMDEP